MSETSSNAADDLRLESLNIQANASGYEVEARFKNDATSFLAELAYQILSNPSAPNFFVAEVNHMESGSRFHVTVERFGGKSVAQALSELRADNLRLTTELAKARGEA